MKRINIFAVLLLFAFGFFANDIFAQRQGNRNFRGQQRGFWTQLNEDQKQELEEKIKELRDAGASKEEVQQAIDGLLESYGIQQPEGDRQRGRFSRVGRRPQNGFLKDLDENQKQAFLEKQKELREEGKTPEEVHTEIGALLQSFGIELPDNWAELQGKRRMGPGSRRGFFAELSEEQRKEVQDRQKELREQNATPKETHAAIKELLNSYGIEVPGNSRFHDRGSRQGFGLRGGFSTELSEEQKETLQNKMKELREQQASREEIHAAVGEMLQSFGVELPDNWEEGAQFRQGRGHRGRFWKQLNKEQREELSAAIKSLKDNGATEKEIREAVNAKLKEFGIEPPQRKRGNQQNQEEVEAEELDAERLELEARNYPNPFNPETSIVYTLKNPEKVFIRIFNTTGQLVRTLLNTDQSSGTHTVIWDGRNDSGLMGTSGMYYYRIDAGANSLTQGMILMK